MSVRQRTQACAWFIAAAATTRRGGGTALFADGARDIVINRSVLVASVG
jgi:hypothetical protein